MKTKSIVIAFLLLVQLLPKNECFAQLSTSMFRDVIEKGREKKTYEQAKNNQNEIQVVFSGLFLFYKTFISSQDQSVCTFSPSCSEYGILSLKSYGLIKGGLMTFDRLTRCNGLSPTHYEIDKNTNLLKDDPTLDKTYQAVIIK